ncbi:MAG: adenosylmethionine--8-amino-7-oxononanoate transaminase [Agarilytica sp.]
MTQTPLSSDQILKLDKQHVWHPYSRCNSELPIFPVASASGCFLTLSSGEKILDGMSSWWSTIHGYNHPELNQAATDQINQMSHVMFGGLTHEPAVRLAKTLVDISPDQLEHVFISDSGSVSVEVALKMALQYWNSLGKTRHSFLTIKKGYHGDTFAAMSVSDPDTGMHGLYSEFLHKNIFAPAPKSQFDGDYIEGDIDELTRLAHAHHSDIAAVILEPIVQGTGGMRFYSAEYLRKVRKLCDELDLLLIADEIATGIGRTGKMFACEHAQITPDILCLGKALTGGYMSLAATLCTTKVAETICEGEAGVFMHGPTFMANPLACAVANKSLELLLRDDWQTRVNNIQQWLTQGLAPCNDLPHVNNVRTLGAIGVIEMKEPVDMKRIQPLFIKHGIWLRPFGKLIYTMPPYISSEENIQQLTGSILKVLIDPEAYDL